MARASRKGVSRSDVSWLVDFFLERAAEDALTADRFANSLSVAGHYEGASMANYHAARLVAYQCDRAVLDAWPHFSQWRAWMLAAARGEDTAAVQS